MLAENASKMEIVVPFLDGLQRLQLTTTSRVSAASVRRNNGSARATPPSATDLRNGSVKP